MAIKTAVRFSPDPNLSAQQTTIENFDPTLTQGTVVMPVQLVAYDDAAPGVTWANCCSGSTCRRGAGWMDSGGSTQHSVRFERVEKRFSTSLETNGYPA